MDQMDELRTLQARAVACARTTQAIQILRETVERAYKLGVSEGRRQAQEQSTPAFVTTPRVS